MGREECFPSEPYNHGKIACFDLKSDRRIFSYHSNKTKATYGNCQSNENGKTSIPVNIKGSLKPGGWNLTLILVA